MSVIKQIFSFRVSHEAVDYLLKWNTVFQIFKNDIENLLLPLFLNCWATNKLLKNLFAKVQQLLFFNIITDL